MRKIKYSQTNKLHYGKYLYRVKIATPLASIFRSEFQRGNFSYAIKRLREYHETIAIGEIPIKSRWRYTEPVAVDEVYKAEKILNILKEQNDYLLRCEYSSLFLYTNNEMIIDKIKKKIDDVEEIHQPSLSQKNYLLENANIIITNKPVDLEYKITFNYKKVQKGLKKWIEANPTRCKAGTSLLESIENGYSVKGMYFFVKNEKDVMLVELLAGDSFSRIDKLVYSLDIDK